MLKKKSSQYLFAFLFPPLIWLLVSLICSAYPFGSSNILLTGDTWAQYAPFIRSFYSKIGSGDSLFFDLSYGGGQTTGFYYAYYALSPFNVLFKIFPRASDWALISIIFVLRNGLSSLFMTMFCRNRVRSDAYCVAAGIAYALCGWGIYFAGDIIWQDGFMLFPLIMMFAFNLADEDKNFRVLSNAAGYIVCLGIAIISNFYIGYIISLAVALIISVTYIRKSWSSVKKILKVLFASLVSVCMSSPVLYVVVDKITTSVRADDDFSSPSLFATVSHFFSGIMPFNPVSKMSVSAGSYEYVSLLMLLGVIMFFFSKNVTKEIKIRNGIILGVLSVSLAVYQVGLIWHGFDSPNRLFNRFSFVFAFMMIYMGAQGISTGSVKWKDKTVITYIAICFVGTVAGVIYDKDMILVLGFALALLYIVTLDKKKALIPFLFAAEMFMSVFLAGNANGVNPPINMYVHHNLTSASAFNKVLYVGSNVRNKGLTSNQNTFEAFASGVNYGTTRFVRSLTGYCSSGTIKGSAYNPVLNSLVGISYGEGDSLIQSKYWTVSYSHEDEDLYAYKYKYPLPAAYIVNEDVNSYVGSGNVFENSNELVLKTASVSDVFTDISTLNTSAVNEKDFYAWSWTFDNDMKNLYIEMHDVPGIKDGKFSLTVNDICVSDSIPWDAKNILFYVGSLSAGDTVTVKVPHDIVSSPQDMKWTVSSLNETAFLEWYNKLNAQSISIKTSAYNKLNCNISSDSDNSLLMTSIPYDSHIKAKVNGSPVEVVPVADKAFCGLRVDKGDSNIEIYCDFGIPSVFYILSVCSFGIAIIMLVVSRILRRKTINSNG